VRQAAGIDVKAITILNFVIERRVADRIRLFPAAEVEVGGFVHIMFSAIGLLVLAGGVWSFFLAAAMRPSRQGS
jgi:hypothetical protein